MDPGLPGLSMTGALKGGLGRFAARLEKTLGDLRAGTHPAKSAHEADPQHSWL